MEEIQEINLHIDNQVFPVKKDILCEHSDYFRAMFSGHFIEKERRDVTIEVADADSMNIILRYMDLGSIDLFIYNLAEIFKLSMAVNFLQITELMKHIERYLDLHLTESNCMEIMDIAEQCSYTNLEHLSAAFGLLSFKSMKPEYIPTIDRLYWYLSHPYLDTDNELDVFKFGFDWISHTETGGDALLIILGCLDMKRLTSNDLKQMSRLIKDYKNSLADKVINCLEWLCNSENISLETITTKRLILCETFTTRVYKETYNIVKESKDRSLKYTLVIHRWNQKFMTYSEEKDIEDWLEIPEKNLEGWSGTAWGNTKLVVVGGQYVDLNEESTGSYMTDVMVYDALRKEWTNHGVELPPCICASVAVLNDLLFIVGGSREGFITSMVYKLEERTYQEMDMSWLEGIQDGLYLCSHKGSMYAATYPRNIYVYEEQLDDCWRPLPIDWSETSGLINSLISFNDYIYCCYERGSVKRFRPGIDKCWEKISLGRYITGICSLKTQITLILAEEEIVRTGKDSSSKTGSHISCECCDSDDYLASDSDTVQALHWECILSREQVRSIYDPRITLRTLAGSCLIVLDLPPSLRMEASKYHQKYLFNYSNVYYV